jgi:hypothetical protein
MSDPEALMSFRHRLLCLSCEHGLLPGFQSERSCNMKVRHLLTAPTKATMLPTGSAFAEAHEKLGRGQVHEEAST